MIGTIFGGIVLLGTGFFGFMSFNAQESPSDLGIIEGELTECPNTPNCVSSYSNDEMHSIPPWDLSRPPKELMTRLRTIFDEAGVEVVSQRNLYIHVVYRSFLFRFPDDLEILIDNQSKKVHFRSSSRVGRSDFGVNRDRINSLIEKL